MPKHTIVSCPAGVPTLLTDTAVTTAQVNAEQMYRLYGTIDTAPPDRLDARVTMLPYEKITTIHALETLFPGVGPAVYLWAWPTSGAVEVSVSHA